MAGVDWASSPDTQSEVPLTGGYVNVVVRVGDTVRRSTGPWTLAVHLLLRHLEAAEFGESPRVLGFDSEGREVLTYIEGEATTYPWPPQLLSDEGVAMLAHLLRRYHDAVADFRPPAGTLWRIGPVHLHDGEIICHGDIGPWNFIWREGEPVGLIDWDFAEPGSPLIDLGQLAFNCVPLSGEDGPRKVGFTSQPDLRQRLRVLCDAYGRFGLAEVLEGVFVAKQLDITRIRELGGRGLEPWARFLVHGDADAFEAEVSWLKSVASSLR